MGYPLHLDLGRFCTKAALADWLGSTYVLGGIVLHDGGANGGHYRYVLRMDEGKWLRNDAKLPKVITQHAALAYTQEAYGLVYLRTPPEG